MVKTYLFPYNRHSRSAKDLARALNVRRIRHYGSRFRGSPRKTVVNWGASGAPGSINGCKVINPPELVAICTDKLRFFQAVEGMCSTPKWTTDANMARQWVSAGKMVMARTILNGRGGDGIVKITEESGMVDAPLYTKYVSKRDEYRVHVINGRVIDVQRKALRHGAQNPDFSIRSHENGFVFVRKNVHAPECVLAESLKAMDAVGLDFGAVDVIYNERKDKAYVLEINTAPGLQGSTVETYKKGLTELCNGS